MLKSISQLIVITFVILFLFNLGHKENISTIKYVNIGGQKIKVDLAVTIAERARGLSGRASLGESDGLLFIFDKPDMYPFWMKDMNFPIDIIWLEPADGDRGDLKIVSIKHNALPASYPETFWPEQDALYVLEVVAGFADKNNLSVGDKTSFGY